MPASSSRRRRALTRGGTLVTGLLACAAVATPADAAVPADRQLEIWPGIEMGVVSGYPGDVRVDVFRGATMVATKDFPGGSGEVNHGADNCWGGVPAGRSPDLKGGDKVVATITSGAFAGQTDFFFLRNIQFDESAPNLITGTASGSATGDLGPSSMAGELIEVQRRDSGGGRTDGSGTVAADGSFSFGLGGPANDGGIASDFLDGGGNTVTEAGAPGSFASACGPRSTTAMSSASHSVINMANVTQDLVVGGPRLAPTNVSVTLGGKTYTPTQNASTWTATIPKADLAALGNNADHDLVASFDDGSPDETRTLRKDVTAPVVGSSLASGAYAGAQSLSLNSDGGEQVRYTMDGSSPVDSSKAYDGLPIGLGAGTHTVNAMAIDGAGNRGDASFSYQVAPAAQAATPQPAPQIITLTTVVPASRSLTVADLTVAKRVRSRTVRRRGVRVSLDLARGTKVVQFSVYRRSNGRRRLVGQVMRRPGRSGAYATRLNTAKLRKALAKAGLYEVVATPGTSTSALSAGDADTIRFRVIR